MNKKEFNKMKCVDRILYWFSHWIFLIVFLIVTYFFINYYMLPFNSHKIPTSQMLIDTFAYVGGSYALFKMGDWIE